MVVNSQKLIRTMKILLGVLLTAGVGCAAAVGLYVKGIWDDPTKSFGGGANFVVTDDAGVTHQYNQGIISFLIVGLDSNEEREAAHKGYRSDVIMVCVVDTQKNQASLISVPRDTRSRVQVLNSEGKPTKMVTTRINAAFSYGFSPDKYGYQNTMAAVNELFNVDGVKIDPITTYIGADMDNFVHVANLLGGVDLQLPYDVPGFGAGGEWIHLEGEKALDYVCIRKGKGLTGMDTDRTERQRGFLKAVAVKMQQLGALSTIPKLYNDCVRQGYVQTNLTIEQIYALSASIDQIDMESVVFEMLPGYINDNEGVGYWHVNRTQLKKMILDLFYNAQQGNGMPTAFSTSAITSSTVGDGTKTEYNYKGKTTTKSTSKKTTSSGNDKKQNNNKNNNNNNNKKPSNNGNSDNSKKPSDNTEKPNDNTEKPSNNNEKPSDNDETKVDKPSDSSGDESGQEE